MGTIFSVHKERIVPCTSNGACSATIGGKNRCLGKISPPWYNGGDTCWGYGEHMHYKILKKEEVPKEILEE